jgi:hypothetical protein
MGSSIFVRADGEADIAALESGPTLMYYSATPGSEWVSTKLRRRHHSRRPRGSNGVD